MGRRQLRHRETCGQTDHRRHRLLRFRWNRRACLLDLARQCGQSRYRVWELKLMQPRPVRSQLYLPVLRFGITDEDWGFVILASIVGYAVPFVLGLKLYQIPAELIGWIVMMGGSVLALNIIRRKSRP